MRRRWATILAAASLVLSLAVGSALLAGCGEPAREGRQTTAPKLNLKKLKEVNYDDTAYYALMEIEGRRCIVFVEHGNPNGTGGGIWCEQGGGTPLGASQGP